MALSRQWHACPWGFRLLAAGGTALVASAVAGFLKYNTPLTIACVVVVIFLMFAAALHCRKRDISRKAYVITTVCVTVAVAALQAVWVYGGYVELPGDPWLTMTQAIHLSSDFSILPEHQSYYDWYPHNIMVTVFYGFLYQLFGHCWYHVEMFYALVADASAVLTGVAVCRATGSRLIAANTLIIIYIYIFDALFLRTLYTLGRSVCGSRSRRLLFVFTAPCFFPALCSHRRLRLYREDNVGDTGHCHNACRGLFCYSPA